MREFLQKKATLAVVGGLGLVAGSYWLLGGEASKRDMLASTDPVVRNTKPATEAPTVTRRSSKVEPVSEVQPVVRKERDEEPEAPVIRDSKREVKALERKKPKVPMA